MRPLAGHVVVALGGMAERGLAHYLTSLGARIEVLPVAANPLANPLWRSASFLIDDLGLEQLADAGLTRSLIQSTNPQLIHVSVTTFGSGGARARWKGGELVASAMGGALRLTGEPDRAPVKEALDACTFHADMVAASGAMAAHAARQQGAPGQHVDVSIQQVAFSRNINGVLVWQFDRRKLHRVGGALNYGKATVRCIWPLADGWCFHSLMTGRFGAPANQALSDWIDAVGMDNPLRGVDWLRYNRSTLDPTVRANWERALEAFFRTRTRAEIRTEGRRRGINACAVAEPSDVLDDPHLQQRSFWQEQAGQRVPSRFVALTEGPPCKVEASRRSQRTARTGPLAGLRVLDFSWALVGSITTKVLGDLGADVVKVETKSRPCLSRLDVQVSASRADDMDDKPWFAHLNTSKRGLGLDLKQAASREVLQPLIDWADVVVENFSPGTMDKLGLGYKDLAARNPRLVMASGSVYGQTGPLAQEWGVDGTGAALSGRTFLTGWPDRDPVIPGAVPYGDVIVPYVMAASIAAAVAYRDQHGSGCHIDASMYEICVQQMRAALASAQRGERVLRLGNAAAGVAYQDVLPAKGEDRWVAITAVTADELAKLQALAQGQALAQWSQQFEEVALVTQLQAAGIAAGVVQDIEDLLERDAELMARDALVTLQHPKLGPFGHICTPLRFSGSPLQPYRAPGLGEHSDEVAASIAGLSPEAIATLRQQGVLQ